ncbi:hypothetical protein JCM11641_007449 [Rhodosporidiobolus odoratus]
MDRPVPPTPSSPSTGLSSLPQSSAPPFLSDFADQDGTLSQAAYRITPSDLLDTATASLLSGSPYWPYSGPSAFPPPSQSSAPHPYQSDVSSFVQRDHRSSLSSAVNSSRWEANFEPWSNPFPPPPILPAESYSLLTQPPYPAPHASSAPAALATIGQLLDARPPTSSIAPALTEHGVGFSSLRTGQYQPRTSGSLDYNSSRIKPFILKLNQLLNQPQMYADCITWNSEGKAFIVHHSKRFEKEVLAKTWGHQNSASFTRQLNVYGFRRLTNGELLSCVDSSDAQQYSAWIHPLFHRGQDRSSLHLLTPRPSRARQAKKAAKEHQAAQQEAHVGAVARARRESQDSAASGWSSTSESAQPALAPPSPRENTSGQRLEELEHQSRSFHYEMP